MKLLILGNGSLLSAARSDLKVMLANKGTHPTGLCTCLAVHLKWADIHAKQLRILSSCAHEHAGYQSLVCQLSMCSCLAQVAAQFKRNTVQGESCIGKFFCLANITLVLRRAYDLMIGYLTCVQKV